MKRILIFNDSLELGGTEKLLVDVLAYLVNEGCQVTLLLPEATEKNILLSQIPLSVKVKYLRKIGASSLRNKIEEQILVFCPSLYRKLKGIREEGFDIAVCFKECQYARLFSGMKNRTVLWVHNILYKRSYTINSLKERLAVWLSKKHLAKIQSSYPLFDKVICVSDACKEALAHIAYGENASQSNIQVLYNSIDLDRVQELSKESINDLPQGQTNFILVSRNSPDKRTDRLLQAVAQLQSENYDFHAYIIGAGLDKESMERNLTRLGIKDRVTALGRIDNPYPYMLQADWLMCVSERESFSLVLIEAMALRTPVITTDCGGPRDIVEGGKYGILVDNSTEGVYKGMKMVLDAPELSVKYSSNLHSALVRYNYNSWLRKLDEILELS